MTLENPLDSKEIQPVHPQGSQSWIFIGRTDTEAEASIVWPPDVKNWLIGKDPKILKAGGEGEDRDGWMASPTQWTWVWVSSGSWWWTGRPGVLQSMGSQRIGHDWATELDWTDATICRIDKLSLNPSNRMWIKWRCSYLLQNKIWKLVS